MENGAIAPLINLGPSSDSTKKKQKEHKEHKKSRENESNKEAKEDINDNTDSNFENDIIEVKVIKEDKDEKEERHNIKRSPNKNESYHENKKAKRHRRTKEEITDKQFRCPDCEKCYLSGPALTIHRKTKHGLELNNDKKIRGRPRKDNIPENPTITSKNKKEKLQKEEDSKEKDNNQEEKEEEEYEINNEESEDIKSDKKKKTLREKNIEERRIQRQIKMKELMKLKAENPSYKDKIKKYKYPKKEIEEKQRKLKENLKK